MGVSDWLNAQLSNGMLGTHPKGGHSASYLNADQSVFVEFRPLSTQALRTLELRALNPTSTSWPAPTLLLRNGVCCGWLTVLASFKQM